MKKLFVTFVAAATAMFLLVSCGGQKFETVPGDPMQTRIYTLDNGLKVYMSINKEQPRIQTNIVIRNGGKNDPADNTGLAHYLEHMMFKGTPTIGTSDYAAEKPLLDSIEALFNVYRTKTDNAERLAIYHKIDSLSFEASKYAIPNEYDKAMALIGSTGSNASTSEDRTSYTENIPSNQVENWAKIQADRFKNLVLRGFHTELETVYEEKNMYSVMDSEKSTEAFMSLLFKNHPYGTQTVIGTTEHLKNPSMTAIKKQYSTMYVPNNCAICVAGDINPDEFMKIVEKYFGDWKPNPSVPALNCKPEAPITSPVSTEVYGPEAEYITMGWRFPAARDAESEAATIVASVLYNGMAGLIDLDVNQNQLAQSVSAGAMSMADYGVFEFEGKPKQGQTLEQVRDIILAEVAKLRAGDFDESLITASVNNQKLRQMQTLERNQGRTGMYVRSFANGTDWKSEVGKLDRLSKLTKEDIVAWANKYLGENSYAIVYKRKGDDATPAKVDAPKITAIMTNRDKQSADLVAIKKSLETIAPIEPVFLDYAKEVTVSSFNGLEVLYKKNEVNDIANFTLSYDLGLIDDSGLGLAVDYLSYLGTESRTAQKIATELYGLAVSFSTRVNRNQMTISLSGLSENIGAALEIVEDLMMNAKADEDILSGIKMDEMKQRHDSKFNQNACNSALGDYIVYGPEYVKKTKMNNAELMKVSSAELLGKVKSLLGKQHKIQYYGPASEAEVAQMLSEHHKVAENLKPVTKTKIDRVLTPSPKVVVVHYDARQVSYAQYSVRGENFSSEQKPYVTLYNEYFGTGMNSIVFQEMREARALAYRARASLAEPATLDDSYMFSATIGTQNDKLQIAVEAFDMIINDMPREQKNFDIAKTAILTRLRTSRTTGAQVLSKFVADRELGLAESLDKKVFETIQNMTMDDLAATQQKWVKGRTYTYGLLGDTRELDMNYLKTLGPVQVVSMDEIFGY
ncbi:MAG: insulinase family protein [Bacteroidales bacterium]|nr:insulinase family protein [Bacteroidales bacterium]